MNKSPEIIEDDKEAVSFAGIILFSTLFAIGVMFVIAGVSDELEALKDPRFEALVTISLFSYPVLLIISFLFEFLAVSNGRFGASIFSYLFGLFGFKFVAAFIDALFPEVNANLSSTKLCLFISSCIALALAHGAIVDWKKVKCKLTQGRII